LITLGYYHAATKSNPKEIFIQISLKPPLQHPEEKYSGFSEIFIEKFQPAAAKTTSACFAQKSGSRSPI
jgi:hypothetical protein